MIPPCLGCISLIQDSPRSLSHADPERGDNLLRLERNSLVLQPAFQISWFLGMLYRRLSTAPVVTIAKVAGRVRGAGNEFILACDMCFASRERAVFGQMEAGLGLLPGAGGVQHLTRLVGRQRAMEVVLSGDDYGAELAAQYGWINRAIADATLDTFVGDLARRIAKFPASGLRAIKTSIANISLPDEHAIRADGAKFLELMNTEEAKSRRAARDERYREDARAEWEMNYGRIIGEL
jgi:enoyl-CoA hydratase/carnithine racemase